MRRLAAGCRAGSCRKSSARDRRPDDDAVSGDGGGAARGEAVALVDPCDRSIRRRRPSAASICGACCGCAASADAASALAALKALSLILQAGGFGLVVLDLADVPRRGAARIPFTTWMRIARIIEGSETVALLVGAGASRAQRRRRHDRAGSPGRPPPHRLVGRLTPRPPLHRYCPAAAHHHRAAGRTLNLEPLIRLASFLPSHAGRRGHRARLLAAAAASRRRAAWCATCRGWAV